MDMDFRILYVCAWGRSGTTLVDNVLNAYPGVFSAGEARYLWQRGIIGNRNCGCGRPFLDCPLWAEIRARAFGANPPDPRHVVDLQRASGRVRHTLTLLRGGASPEGDEYGDLLARVYRAIAATTGAKVIVDSSKTPANAALLSRRTDLDVSLLHMVRDPRAVAHSWSRPTAHRDRGGLMMRHSAGRSTANWVVWNALIELLRRRHGDRYLRVRYEDLTSDPRGEIERIARFAGVSPRGGPFVAADLVRLPVNHTVSGNPKRFAYGETAIARDDAWRCDQAARDRWVASMIGVPFVLRYHYPLVPRRHHPG
jgi:hypothetical protein